MIGGDPFRAWLLLHWAPLLAAGGGVAALIIAAWLASLLATAGLRHE